MTTDNDKIVEQLCHQPDGTASILKRTKGRLPSGQRLKEIMQLIREVMFPDFFAEVAPSPNVLRHVTAVRLEDIRTELATQIRRAARIGEKPDIDSNAVAEAFIAHLPELRSLLLTDVDAMFDNDPAAIDRAEIIFCYPAFTGMLHYRIAHALLTAGVPLLPRMITEMAHSRTGIDIHPGAVIGPYFSIDHGTGVVIGETSRIGCHVSIYQGVTLGAKNFVLDSNGHPLNVPRHPIIEDHVTIYSNATILGRITIGSHAVIGGNLWVTSNVPAYARLNQRQVVDQRFIDGAGI